MNHLNLPSPIEHIDTFENNVSLYLKREDLIHPEFGGNKWRKLNLNIKYFKNSQYKTIVTFGGAFSNHIAATAAICNYHNIPSVGIIRGDYSDPNNPTLQKAKGNKMQLHHVSKIDYKSKEENPKISEIINGYSDALVIPEGGSNLLAKKGIAEMVNEFQTQDSFDYIFIAAGTGMTAAGIIEYSPSSKFIYVLNALKNESLQETIESQLNNNSKNWLILNDYTFGGYAKYNNTLLSFNKEIQSKYNIILDPIYNIKMFYGALDLISKNIFTANTKVLCIITGGQQGIDGYEYVNKIKWRY